MLKGRTVTSVSVLILDSLHNLMSFYQKLGDDGVTYTVNYIADENGYRAEGDHLPKSVPELSEEEIVGVEEPTIGLSPSAVLSLVGG